MSYPIFNTRLFFNRLAQQLFELSAFIRSARAQKQLFALESLESQNDLSWWENSQPHEETTEEITEKIPCNSLSLMGSSSEDHAKIPKNLGIKSKKTQQTLTLDSATTPIPTSIKTNSLKKNLNHTPSLINSKDFFKKNTQSKHADAATHLENSQMNPYHATLQRTDPKSPINFKSLEKNVLSESNVEKKSSFLLKKEISFVKSLNIKVPQDLKKNLKKSEEIKQHTHSNPLKKEKILSKSFETHTLKNFSKYRKDELRRALKPHSTLDKFQAFHTNLLKDSDHFKTTPDNTHEEFPDDLKKIKNPLIQPLIRKFPDDSKKVNNPLIQPMIQALQKKIRPAAFKTQYTKKFVQNKIDPLREISTDFKIKIQIDCIKIDAKAKKSRVSPPLDSTNSKISKIKAVSLIDYLTQPRRSSS